MTLGYEGRLYFLAFDHRGGPVRALFGIDGEPDARQIARIAFAKLLVFEGLVSAIESGAVPAREAGVLVDERFGGGVPRLARERGITLAMPVEKTEQEVFEFEYGDRFGDHIELFDPDFSKVLVRLNPDGDTEGNRRQLERLRRLADWLHERDRKLLFELLVPPTDWQLAAVGGDLRAYEAELRPELIRRGIAEVQEHGVEVDVWKLEGVETVVDAEAVARQARSGSGRDQVTCILLGAGAGEERVERWLAVTACAEGFSGFAIGRSIWSEPLRAYLGGEVGRGEAARRIGARYLRFIEVEVEARTGAAA
jgi:myo-inositol catabolism protein IolC